MIQANDFRRQWEDLREDALAAFEMVGASGWYVLGDEVRAFEDALAALWGFPHAAGVASGLDAIEIALRALGCRPGDRVLTTPISAFATTLAIVKIGAVPVFVDTDDQGLIDLVRCGELLQKRSDIRFFVPVHLYGFALDPSALRRLRDEYGLLMVEDCAQSTKAAGDLAATSFYPTKHLGAMGDGGAILMKDAALDTRVRALRDYGQTAKYQHDFIGYNSRLDELQAAYLRRAFRGWSAGYRGAGRSRRRIYRESGILPCVCRTRRRDRRRRGICFLYGSILHAATALVRSTIPSRFRTRRLYAMSSSKNPSPAKTRGDCARAR